MSRAKKKKTIIFYSLDLHSELLLFEEWLNETEEQLSTFTSIRSDDLSLEDFQYKLHQHTVRFAFVIGQWFNNK